MKAGARTFRALALVGACLAPPIALAQEQIEVFVVGDQQIAAAAGAGAVYHVDALARQLEELSAGLPADPERAAAIAKARFERLTSAELTRLQTGAEVEELARRYGLLKAPAMVIDGRAVIYGVHDVDRARAIYRAWRARQGG